jgi:predicted DsbA family dithiol-disulfide isomerase
MFWEMHDRLFENSKKLEPLTAHAVSIGLNAGTFDTCMASDESAAEIRKDMAVAHGVGITGTPGFVIGTTDPDDPSKISGLLFVNGAMHYSAFRLQIEKALKMKD